jgi:hypothetical protein
MIPLKGLLYRCLSAYGLLARLAPGPRLNRRALRVQELELVRTGMMSLSDLDRLKLRFRTLTEAKQGAMDTDR